MLPSPPSYLLTNYPFIDIFVHVWNIVKGYEVTGKEKWGGDGGRVLLLLVGGGG